MGRTRRRIVSHVPWLGVIKLGDLDCELNSGGQLHLDGIAFLRELVASEEHLCEAGLIRNPCGRTAILGISTVRKGSGPVIMMSTHPLLGWAYLMSCSWKITRESFCRNDRLAQAGDGEAGARHSKQSRVTFLGCGLRRRARDQNISEWRSGRSDDLVESPHGGSGNSDRMSGTWASPEYSRAASIVARVCFPGSGTSSVHLGASGD